MSRFNFVSLKVKDILKTGLNQDRCLGLLAMYFSPADAGEQLKGEDYHFGRALIKRHFSRLKTRQIEAENEAKGIVMVSPKFVKRPRSTERGYAGTIVRLYRGGTPWEQIKGLIPLTHLRLALTQALGELALADDVDCGELIEALETLGQE